MARLFGRLKLRRNEVEGLRDEALKLERGLFKGFLNRVAGLVKNNPEMLRTLLTLLGVPATVIDTLVPK